MLKNREAFREATDLWIDKIASALLSEEEDLETMNELRQQMNLRLSGKRATGTGALHMLMQWPQLPYIRKSMQLTAMLDLKPKNAWVMYGFVLEPIESWADHHIILSWRKSFRRKEKFSDDSARYTETRGYVEYIPAMADLQPVDDGIDISLKAQLPGGRPIDVWKKFPLKQREEPMWMRQMHRRQEALAQTHAMSEYLAVQRGDKPSRYRTSPPDECDLCGRSFRDLDYLVDGRVGKGLRWADMCVNCFAVNGGVVGWGSGQMYQKQSDGKWLLVGGYPPDREEL
ncbi:hypothetical protein KQI65_15900 [bacterium]|nr:hypothetical protein [bacterium]